MVPNCLLRKLSSSMTCSCPQSCQPEVIFCALNFWIGGKDDQKCENVSFWTVLSQENMMDKRKIYMYIYLMSPERGILWLVGLIFTLGLSSYSWGVSLSTPAAMHAFPKSRASWEEASPQAFAIVWGEKWLCSMQWLEDPRERDPIASFKPFFSSLYSPGWLWIHNLSPLFFSSGGITGMKTIIFIDTNCKQLI